MIAALKEIVDAHRRGATLTRRLTVRTVERLPDPRQYDPADVRETRELVGASQAVFARLIGVSIDQAQSWEQGRRQPSPMARRLFDEIRRDPSHWRAMIHSAA